MFLLSEDLAVSELNLCTTTSHSLSESAEEGSHTHGLHQVDTGKKGFCTLSVKKVSF